MRTHSTLKRATGILAAILFWSVPALGQSTGSPVEPVPPDPAVLEAEFASEAEAETGATYARIRHFEGGVTLQRENEESGFLPEVAVNSPLIPGDEVFTEAHGRVEIQLADGSFLRLDGESRLRLLNLADREATFDDTTLVALPQGSLHVRADGFDAQERRFQIDTPAGSIFLLSPGVFRIDVTPTGVTTLASFRGVAELFSEEVSVIAHSGEHVSAAPGRGPSEARAFNTLRRDEFDLWAEGRDDAIASAATGEGAVPDVPEPVRPYVSELSLYGEWRLDAAYGWIWIPSGVSATWRPYYYGHWVYAPIGFIWVSSEPWGWAPYHYGRWHYGPTFGWFWAPGHLFAGAYVQWAIGPTYYAWSPIGFYDFPVLHVHSPWVYVPHTYIFHVHVNKHMHGWAYAARHHFRNNLVILRKHPPIRPRYRLESAGTVAYGLARKLPRVAVNDRPRDGGPGLSFRHKELPRYRRLAANRHSSGSRSLQPAPGTKGRLRSVPRSGRVPAVPGAAAPVRQITPDTGKGGRTDPIPSGMRTSTRPRVSPATGRPIPPPVTASPAATRNRQEPGARPRVRRAAPAGGAAVEPGGNARAQGRRVVAPAPGGAAAASIQTRANQRGSSKRVAPARPHPRVEPRERTPGTRFIMKRPAASAKSKAVKRSGSSRGAPAKPPAKKGNRGRGGKDKK